MGESSDARTRWDGKYRRGEGPPPEPSAFLLGAAAELPAPGRCLDVGGGSGRNALWLARRGWHVTICDISPEGLALAEAAAEAAGLRPRIETLERDLERDGLPPGSWDLLLCIRFLHRPLFRQWAAALEPGGMLVFEQPTVRNEERHPRPGRRYQLAEGEARRRLEGLEVLRHEEGWNESGRHDARLLARRPLA